MTRVKCVNGVYSDFTAEEEAEADTRIEAADLDLGLTRHQRNGYLRQSDLTQVGDFPLGSDSLADWQTYREALRDLLATAGLRNSNVVWPKSPAITRIGQAAYDTEVAKDGSGPAAGEAARTAAEQAAGWPGPGI